ncbi:MAG: low-specificity L-threonine aldolase [Deltaproteobacteria bacterium]|nr:low-specificity L-threonine aldolase [Deltaproteobacteria bacterium]
MAQRMIDLRSDTVTRPGTAMREAMASAEVGDDVFGEDPSVNALQTEAANLLGKEAALFVPSGTMANQVALKAHTSAGDEVIIHPDAHIVRAESAAGAALAGVQFRYVGEPDGSLDPERVAPLISDGANPHFAPTRLICLENTHNFAGGSVIPLERMRELSTLARERGLPLHLDGARLLNAAAVLKVAPAEITALVDSTTLCLSKGLGAPVGSLIAGRADFIRRCLRFRKMYGGGMRQAGILAAAGRYALAHNVARLGEDHENAALLARGLLETGHIKLLHGLPQTNLLFFSLEHPRLDVPALAAELARRGVLIGALGPAMARAVTNLDVSRDDIQTALAQISDILGH